LELQQTTSVYDNSLASNFWQRQVDSQKCVVHMAASLFKLFCGILAAILARHVSFVPRAQPYRKGCFQHWQRAAQEQLGEQYARGGFWLRVQS
jgi:hypothetical protein